MTDPKRLYEEDFALWAQQQAEALRAAAQGGSNRPLDWEHLAEEIEDLAGSQRSALSSHIMRIIQHLVKLEYSPAVEPRNGWRRTIRLARIQAGRRLEKNPSLKAELGRLVEGEMRHGIELAIVDLEEHGEIDEVEADVLRRARYTVEQVLGDWFPPEPPRD
ncbi:MAG TPA: DUF29 domain-containing protein [Stellaceae bacterium]|nr:DUF29 domain-containing protein [Stellaceae bacterium]